MQQNIQQHRVIVIGAGYTGASAAGRLARRLRREDVSITLVNAEADFVERVRMHQLAVGQDLRPRPFDEMFAGTGVRLRLGKVTGIDVDRRTVSVTAPEGTGEPETLPYDTLVYALGSAWSTHAVPAPPNTPTTSPAAPAHCACASVWQPWLPARPWSS